ncbi:MAG: hypothetical protein MUE40_04830 [Anaerolineae bacterium]|nr:hypothetical protein [Anaerolineae bacterium]
MTLNDDKPAGIRATSTGTMAAVAVRGDRQIQRLAWGIVWLTFSLLCVLCAATSLGLYYFMFESSVALEARLQVGRGTTLIFTPGDGERGVRQSDALASRPAQISTDLQSQATLSFIEEAGETTRLIAALTLRNNSQVNFWRATRPRFEWSRGRYEIELRGFEGEMDILIGGGDGRAIAVQVLTERGELVLMNQIGRYTVSASSSRVAVANREGEMLLFAANRQNNLLVPRGQDAIMPAGRSPVLSPGRENLLENGLFVFQPAAGNDMLALPGRWGCTSVQVAAPRGVFEAGFFDGRSALRLRRGDAASTNGETRCRQPFAQPGKDVRGYNYLELETTFLLDFQSLSQCGVQGSECPLMLRMEYVDVNGVPREWYQGFYYALDPVYNYYPPRCQSCTQEHLQMNAGVWYTFESGNFFTVLPEDLRPAAITNIEFYASGHQYDVYVSEIALYAGIAEAVPIEVPAGTGG